MIPPAECLTLWEMEVECNGVFRLWKQVVWGVCAGEDVEMEGLDVLKPPGDAHGEDDVAGENVVEEVFHRVGGLFVVYTIENKEGAGMLAEPCDDSGAALVVGGVVREIEVVDEDDGKLGKGALEGLGTGGVGKEEGIILSGVAMGVFAGEPGLAYAAETVRGGDFGIHINTDGVRSGLEGVAETGEVAIAAHKERAEGRIGEIGGREGGDALRRLGAGAVAAVAPGIVAIPFERFAAPFLRVLVARVWQLPQRRTRFLAESSLVFA